MEEMQNFKLAKLILK